LVPVRLQLETLPDIVNGRLAHPLGFGQPPTTPLRHAFRLGGQRRRHDRRDLALPIAWLAASPRGHFPHTVQPLLRKALTVLRFTAKPRAIALSDRPSAAASTIRLLSATSCGVPNADTHCCSCCASASSSCNAGVDRGTFSA